jgi:uncharacterized DUF497 family protein
VTSEDEWPDEYDWDDDKNDRTLNERGYDFAFASGIFDGIYLERRDTRKDYGEPRFVVFGQVDEAILQLVWTPRGLIRRIISSRPANEHEETIYRAYRKTIKQ